MKKEKIILASQSPRRKQLLECAEINFEVKVVETDETYPSNLSNEDITIYIAKNKAKAVLNTIEDKNITVIAADTIVFLNNKVIGKPTDRNDAIEILKSLSGKIHHVITGVVILKKNDEICFSDITEVEFHKLSTEQIEFYVDKFKPYDKAGAYAIQEWIGVVGIKKINGDFYNVMGLPVSKLLKKLL